MSKGPWKKPETNMGIFALPIALVAMVIGATIQATTYAVHLSWPEIAPRSNQKKSRHTQGEQHQR